MGGDTEGIDLRRSAQCQQEALYEGLMGAGFALAFSAPLVYVARRNYPMLVRSASVQTVRAVPFPLPFQHPWVSRAGAFGDGSGHPASELSPRWTSGRSPALTRPPVCNVLASGTRILARVLQLLPAERAHHQRVRPET
jgi:hypothetical protein